MQTIFNSDLGSIHEALSSKKNRFAGATILITGCAGFLGFYFMNYLARYAAELKIEKIIGLDTFLLDKPKWLDQLLATYPAVVELHHFDISRDDLSKITGAEKARYVLHLASIASPTFYRQYPLETIDANIWGLRHLLNFFQNRKSLEGLLFFSSSEIYGDPDAANIPTAEDYRGNVACVGPRACYDASNRFGETLCQVFPEKYGVPITVARPFNNYGPGMRLGDKRLPADLASCVLQDRDIVLYSNGSPTRTFCYITDAVIGYFLCLLHGKFEAFNIGIETPEITVKQLADYFQLAGQKLKSYKGTVRFEVSSDTSYLSHNPQRRCPIIAKARQVLNYNPQISVQDGVHRYLQFLIETGAM